MNYKQLHERISRIRKAGGQPHREYFAAVEDLKACVYTQIPTSFIVEAFKQRLTEKQILRLIKVCDDWNTESAKRAILRFHTQNFLTPEERKELQKHEAYLSRKPITEQAKRRYKKRVERKKKVATTQRWNEIKKEQRKLTRASQSEYKPPKKPFFVG